MDKEADIWYPATTTNAKRSQIGALGKTNECVFRNGNGPAAKFQKVGEIIQQLKSFVFDLKWISFESV